ncbi:phospholipase [Phytoactinopolyspora endophytica]|uniref:phospholipase n=1 Tax=Phytoactinopolyspora endophytica TaxID=1642495 RepID=UPI00101C1CDC|nr:phospholipase [Phytoactinopolyspora endophytica]
MKSHAIRGAALITTSLVAASVVAGGAAATAATAAAGGHELTVVDSTVITEVTPLGLKVTGLAVEYDGVVHVGRDAIDEDAFDVEATLERPGAEPLVGDRTVVDAYTNRTPEFTDRQRPGRFVILELHENDDLAGASYNDVYTRFYDLDGAYDVAQVMDIDARPHTIEAQPGNVLANSAVDTLIVDEYDGGTFDAEAGVTLPYRMYSPDVTGRKTYPLVVTLHGYGESGTNNVSQIAGNQISVAFADPERQARHPAFVLSPQADPLTPDTGGWWDPPMQEAVVELVRKTLAENPAIDPDRVYLTGLSMGSYGSWGLLPEYHDLFAGAILVCGAGGDEAAAASTLGEFPIWAVHSIDDSIVAYDQPGSDYRIFTAIEAAGYPVTWSEWAGTAPDAAQEAYAAEARDRALATRSNHIFTTFPAGTTPLFDHGSWIPTYTNDVIIDWLFAQ